MDLLIEKDDKRTYLSRYKVITTSFEESSPSVKRNNTQIQYRNGNVDFGGWNEAKTIDYVGYYRADDLEDEEYLRERIYALLSDPEGYYITQLKNDNNDSFERPGETSGDYFDKQVNRPSHKRFYVYASSLESEFVGSYGGHVLYKISATFTTMKLPYGESVPRDLDIKPNVSAVGTNLITSTSSDWVSRTSSGHVLRIFHYTVTSDMVGNNYTFSVEQQDSSNGGIHVEAWYRDSSGNRKVLKFPSYSSTAGTDYVTFTVTSSMVTLDLVVGAYNISNQVENIRHEKLELGSHVTDWCPNQKDPGYNEWYLNTYYNTNNLVIPYAGTVPCSQLEQGFTIEFTAKQSSSGLTIIVNDTKFTYSGQVYSGDVIKLSGYEYTKNGISVVKYTNKDFFKLLPGVTNKISCSISGAIRILGYQDLYA